jgi:hypothetical protein
MPSPLTTAPAEIPPAAPAPASGDDCPRCDGHLIVTSSQKRGSFNVRYLRCWKCKVAPENGQQVVPASEIVKRRPRKKKPY